MLKQKFFLVLAFLLMFLCSGCFVLGTNKNYHPFESEALSSVKPGQTTAQEILSLFGAPTEMVKLSNGNAYIYHRSVAKGTVIWLIFISFGNYDKQADQIVFFFDNNDLLTNYGVSLNAKNAEYGLPF
jgi:outer membrane protein assembly factor BamE (lipoprotein component of BamABCDE complex)